MNKNLKMCVLVTLECTMYVHMIRSFAFDFIHLFISTKDLFVNLHCHASVNNMIYECLHSIDAFKNDKKARLFVRCVYMSFCMKLCALLK